MRGPCPRAPPPDRWPGFSSPTAARSWPGRTPRCCSPTSAPTWSRSSRRRATRRAAGVRPGSRPGRTVRRPRHGRVLPGGEPNKRSIRLDLRAEGGARVLRRLLAQADVVVENFRVGGFARLGFDDAALERLNPRLVHLAISGYGPTGPLAATPGYDFIVQAVSGLMSITGFPGEEGGRPTKVGVAITDLATGMLGAVAVLAALDGRDRAGSPAFGRGQRIDISLLESTLAWLANQAQNLFATGVAPDRRGNGHPNIVPYETFATSDGEIAVAVGSERQWGRFADAIGAPELADDPRFATNWSAGGQQGGFRPLIAAASPRRRAPRGWSACAAAEVPAGPSTTGGCLRCPAGRGRGLLVDVEHPVLGRLRRSAAVRPLGHARHRSGPRRRSSASRPRRSSRSWGMRRPRSPAAGGGDDLTRAEPGHGPAVPARGVGKVSGSRPPRPRP